ncbi:hypothetical protein SPRG_18102, partial [Saprolegnia parasitica CBS 223.65]
MEAPSPARDRRGEPKKADGLFTLQQDPAYQLHFVNHEKPKPERPTNAGLASPSSLR